VAGEESLEGPEIKVAITVLQCEQRLHEAGQIRAQIRIGGEA
jgi:hypothetical protein